MDILDLFKKNVLEKNKITSPFIIAEAGVNHEGSLTTAKKLIDDAKEGGANAIKFQTYKAEKLASKTSPAYWDTTKEPTQSQYELFKKHDKFWKNEMVLLKNHCDKVGIEFMSTAFDFESAKFLSEMLSVFKISSSDITNKPFIEFIAQFGKPVILSTGASDLCEIQEAVGWLSKYDVPVALLHCILNYPTSTKNANLGKITGLKEAFPNKVIGYSDHTLPGKMEIIEMATLLGCQIIEKHFTHDKSLPGNDHYHAMDKHDLKYFLHNIKKILEIIGEVQVKSFECESISRKNARRSIVAANDLPKGKTIEIRDLTFKRPAYGISPQFIDDVLGKKAIRDIVGDEILYWDLLHD